MKLSKLRVALQARPWLMKSIEQVTGKHPSQVAGFDPQPGYWLAHIEDWAVRNISEIVEREFDSLNLDEKAEFNRFKFGQVDQFNWSNRVRDDRNDASSCGYEHRQFESFTHTEFHVFGHSSYDANWSARYSQCYTASSTGGKGPPTTLRVALKNMTQPHHLREHIMVEEPFLFDAVVRITKVGVIGRCSSAIVDIFTFPADFDAKKL